MKLLQVENYHIVIPMNKWDILLKGKPNSLQVVRRLY